MSMYNKTSGKNKNYFCILDFETDHLKIDEINPVQLSSLIIDPLSLEIVPDSEFDSGIRPPSIDEPDYYEKHKSTIDFHCRIKQKTYQEVINEWKQNPPEDVVWKNFVEYLRKYHYKTKTKNMFSSPIPVTENGTFFDLPIINKLCNKYGNVTPSGDQNILCMKNQVDLKMLYFLWWENLEDGPPSLSADNVYPWLGLDTSGRHDSLVDIRGAAKVFIKFMKYIRRISEQTKFKGSFLDEKN